LFLKEKYAEELKGRPAIILHDLGAYWKRLGVVSLITALLLFGVFFISTSSFSFLPRLFLSVVVAAFTFILTWIVSQRYLPAASQKKLAGFSIVVSPHQIAKEGVNYQYVWLCVSASAIREGGGRWVKELVEAVGKSSPGFVLVYLTPGVDDREFLLSLFPHNDRIVGGTTPIVSYQVPLKDAEWQPTTGSDGIAYFFMGSSVLSGPRPAAQPIANLLKKGGIGATVVTDPAKARIAMAPMVGAGTAFWVSLEISDWSFKTLLNEKGGITLTEAAGAAREAIRINILKSNGTVPSLVNIICTPLLFRFVLHVIPFVFPCDFQAFLKYHFTKVGDQTVLFLRDYLEFAASKGISVPALTKMTQKLESKRQK